MNEVTEIDDPRSVAGYRLGDPIALEDLLALPPDGRRCRYTRDGEGRLALMSPEDPRQHRWPISRLVTTLVQVCGTRWAVVQEPGIAFPIIRALDGRLLPPSRLGPRLLEPDAAVVDPSPTFVEDAEGVERGFAPACVRLVVEVLSPGTHRADLGLGVADDVDRLRSYLESGISEYWVLNPRPERIALPGRSGLFLRNMGERWAPLEGDDLRVEEQVEGRLPVTAGRVRSCALPGVVFDVDDLWRHLV